MSSKSTSRNSILLCSSLLISLFLTIFLTKIITLINFLLYAKFFNSFSIGSPSKLFMNIEIYSISAIFATIFGRFIFLDFKTIIQIRSGDPIKSGKPNKSFSESREYLNKAYNLYDKIPNFIFLYSFVLPI